MRKLLTVVVTVFLMLSIAMPAGAVVYKANDGEERPLLTILNAGVMADFDERMVQMLWDATGCDFDINLYAVSEYASKLATLIASQDMPDVFLVQDMATLNRLYEFGALMPLDDLINEYGPNLLEDKKEYLTGGVVFDGQIYAVPSTYLIVPDVVILRADWLENLGLEVPTTIDAFYETMRAFTFDDPDGDGVDNTYGLFQLPRQVFGAYGINNAAYNLMDGKVIPAFLHPHYLEAISLFNKMYNEGILDPDWAIIGWDAGVAKYYGGQVGVFSGGISMMDPNAWQQNPEARVIATLLEGPYGDRCGPATDITSINVTCVSANSPHGKEAVQLLDWLVSEEGDLFVNYGIEGVTFNWSDESRTIPVLTEEYRDGNARAQFGIGMLGRMRSRMFGYTAAAWTPEQREGNQMILENILPGVGIYQQLPIEIEIGNTLSTLISEAVADLIVCSPDEVEALYESYVQRYMENGGAEWIEQATAYYQERK